MDREYARSQLPPGSPGNSAAAFTLTALQARAADYYAQIRTPRESWRTLDDVRPQLAEFELRCDTGDYDTAATVLEDIDFDYLQVWGRYRTLAGLHERIRGRISDPALNATHLANLGLCHDSLGEYRRAIDLQKQALAIAREIGDRRGEGGELGNLGNCHSAWASTGAPSTAHRGAGHRPRHRRPAGRGQPLGNLGLCHYGLGEYRRAIDLYSQALAIARDIGDRQGEGNPLGNLGLCHYSLGEYRRAIDLYTQALAIARDIGDRQGEGNALGNLGNCHYEPGRVPAGHRPVHPGAGHRPRHRRPPRRGDRA